MPMGMDASMLIPSGLLSPPSLDPSPLSQAVSASSSVRQPGSLGHHSGSAGQLGGSVGQPPRTRSSLNPAAPGFQSMRQPVANGLHPGPPKQQTTGKSRFTASGILAGLPRLSVGNVRTAARSTACLAVMRLCIQCSDFDSRMARLTFTLQCLCCTSLMVDTILYALGLPCQLPVLVSGNAEAYLTSVCLGAGWEGSKAAPRAQHPQHMQHAQHASAAAAASHRCLSMVTRCLWHCEYFVQGLLNAPPGQLQQNAVLPALAEALRAWGRADDKAPNRAVQEQLAGAISMLQDALGSAFPQLFKQGMDCSIA